MHAATRILVVEDDPAIREFFSNILRADGYEVIATATGESALQIAREMHPEVVLLDVTLTPGMDGMEVCRRIKKDAALADVFVILISGQAHSPEDKVAGLGAGADEYLSKPLTPAELRARIRAMARLQAAAASLRASEQYYRRLIEILPDAVAVIDLQGRVRAANPQTLTLLGYTKETELLAQTIFDLTPPEDHERNWVEPDEALQFRQPRTFASRLKRRDGQTLPIELSVAVSKGNDGQPDGFVVVARDTTQRLRAEAALRESEARKAAVMQAALDGIITIDHAGRIIEFNAAAETIFGCNRARVLGEAMATVIFPPSRRDWFQRALTHSFAVDQDQVGDGRMEMSGQRADGTEFPMECSIVRIEREGPPLFSAFVRDISMRQRGEAQLATLAHAVESTGDLIGITDLQNRFIFVNRAFRQAYGYTEAEILGQTPELLFPPGQPPSSITRIREPNQSPSWQGEVLNRRKDGTEFPIFLRTSQIKDRNGQPIGLMGMAQDITERKRAEEQIRLMAASVQSTHEMICITDPENRFIFANQAFLAGHGYAA
jgi:PAS domain S-box-containing protein